MFYDNLKAACAENNASVSSIVKECGGAVGSINGWKKGAIPNSKIVMDLSLRLNVTTDYLLFGKEHSTSNIAHSTADAITLSENEQELLEVFGKFTDREQIKIIGKMEEWLAEKQRRAATATTKPNVQTAYIASRSFDNMPPRTVTGDFSDVLNAPDATDEY